MIVKYILQDNENNLIMASVDYAEDIVEVVRCKDCKKFRNAICGKFKICTNLTDYCSYGERRK